MQTNIANIKLSSETRWSDRVCSGDGDWSGNIFDFYYRVVDRLTADVKRPFRLDDEMTRIDDTQVHKVIRECLANALIHADYYGRRGIVIDKEFNKITISNPGTFRIDINEAIAGGISDARNSLIFNMFSLINVGERSGIGLCDVYSICRSNGFTQPLLVETVDPDRITLTIEMSACDTVTNDGTNVADDGTNVANDVANVAKNVANVADDVVNVANVAKDVTTSHSSYVMTELEQSIYDFIVSHANTSTKEIADAIGATMRTVQRGVKELEENKVIKRAGTRKNIEWIILK